jgi:hypothetical protein
MHHRLLTAVLIGVATLSTATAAGAPCQRAWQTGLPELSPGSLLYTSVVYDDGSGPSLYVGGLIDDPVQALARFDGSAFVGVGGGLNHTHGGYTEVHALAVYGGELIAAGDFSLAGNVPASNIARWNGVRWAPLGEGSQEIVYALTVHDGRLIAGSRAWDGQTWTPLAGGVHIGTTLAYAGSSSSRGRRASGSTRRRHSASPGIASPRVATR